MVAGKKTKTYGVIIMPSGKKSKRKKIKTHKRKKHRRKDRHKKKKR